MIMINGISFWRKKRRLTVSELSDLTGVSRSTILALEHEIKLSTALTVYKAIANALGVTIAMLLASYDESELADGDRHRKRVRKEFGASEIAVYCTKHNLTYRQLANRLGLTSSERARQLCMADTVPVKHISKLASFEGLTIEEFCELYAA